MRRHEIKCSLILYADILARGTTGVWGVTAEHPAQVDDELHLREWDEHSGAYTDREIIADVMSVINGDHSPRIFYATIRVWMSSGRPLAGQLARADKHAAEEAAASAGG